MVRYNCMLPPRPCLWEQVAITSFRMWDLDMLFNNRRLLVMKHHLGVKHIASDLIREFEPEEPFLICDIGEVIKRHTEWVTHMPRIRPFYAMKCNDSPLVLETLAGLGAGFDCASKIEMNKALDLGISPRDIIYANPVKPRSHIIAASEWGIRTVTFDNKTELVKLKKYLPGAKLVVRIRCEAKMAQCPLGMKFGVSVPEAIELLKVAKSFDLNVIGVCFHVGSGCQDPPVFFKAIANAKHLFEFAARELGYNFTLLDIGGGFPGNSGSNIEEYAGVVNSALERFFPDGCGVEVIAEPGRYYVASAFTLFAQIYSIRESEDENTMYYINDGIYGSLNCLMYDNRKVHPEPLDKKIKGAQLFKCSIWGPTCDGLDKVCSGELLPTMEIGDWLAFGDMGAYTLVCGTTFNGFPLTKLYTVASPTAWETLKDFMRPGAVLFHDTSLPTFIKSTDSNEGGVWDDDIQNPTQYTSDESEDEKLSHSSFISTSSDDEFIMS